MHIGHIHTSISITPSAAKKIDWPFPLVDKLPTDPKETCTAKQKDDRAKEIAVSLKDDIHEPQKIRIN